MARVEEATRTSTVSIRAEGFVPAAIEIRAGTAVTWTNDDTHDHTVSSAEIESGGIGPGQSFSYTFDRPGHYRYFCMVHPRSVAEVFVR